MKYPNTIWSKWIGPFFLTYFRAGKGPTIAWSIHWVRPRRERQFTYGSHVVDRDEEPVVELRGVAARRAAEILTRRGMA